MSQWWSWTLAVIGIIGLYLVGKHSLWGWIIGACVQFWWILYAIITKQWGFIVSALAYGTINIRNYVRWNKERKEVV